MAAPWGILRRERGFSLVELLVAVALGVVLLVLGAGVGPRVLSASRNAGCLGNLRVLAQACFTYAADHRNELPFRYVEGAGWSGFGSPLWYVALAPYAGQEVSNAKYGELAAPGPFRCPADRVPWVGGGPGVFKPSCSYSFPLPLAYYAKGGATPVTDGTPPNLLTRFADRSQTVMLIDSVFGNVFNVRFATSSTSQNDPEETGQRLAQRHDGHLNAVFADGHCEAIAGNTPASDPKRPLLWGNP